MFQKLKKFGFVFALIASLVFTGAWQAGSGLPVAQTPTAPLAPGLTWNNLGQTARPMQLNIKGDALELSGQTYRSAESFSGAVSASVANFYSNDELYKLGWVSDDAYKAEDGIHQVFTNAAGYYLSVDYVNSADDPNSVSVVVWLSAPKDSGRFIAGTNVVSIDAAATLNKLNPANNATGVDPHLTILKWTDYPADKYSYCIKDPIKLNACAPSDPNWTGTFKNTAWIVTMLNPLTQYSWNVKAITYDGTKKLFTYADGGTFWNFKTGMSTLYISGSVGKAGVTMRYWADGTTDFHYVTSDSNGKYILSVPYDWTGYVKPSLTGYTFSPWNKHFTTPVETNQVANFIPLTSFIISGNVGTAYAKLTWVDHSVTYSTTADVYGKYSFYVSYNWEGTVTPSKPGATFSPSHRDYVAVLSNQTNQNYTLVVYTIAGYAGAPGVTLSYYYGGNRSVTSDSNGYYSLTVPYNWTGTVKPTKTGVSSFTPAQRSYTNVLSNLTGQNYRANYVLGFASIGTQDGYVRESFEGSGVGGVANSTTTLKIGDTTGNEQILSILSFNTSALPDNAVITGVRLKIYKQMIAGVNPMGLFGNLIIDVQKNYFGPSLSLTLDDFAAYAGGANGGVVNSVPTGMIYTGSVTTAGGLGQVNRAGYTQFRLRFASPTNADNATNFISFYSGETTATAYRPVLIVFYYVP